MRFLLVAAMAGAAAGSSAADADGQKLYETYCQVCHGSQGNGDGDGIPEGVLRPRPFSAGAFKFDTDADWETGTDADLNNVIRNGPGAYGGSTLMPPWPSLTDEEVAALVGYVRVLEQQ